MPVTRGGNRKHKTTESVIDRKERQAKALELRKAGVDFPTIASRLGYAGPSGAYQAVMSALRDMLQEPADELRALEVERLDRLMLGLWNKATAGDTWAVDRVLKIMERRALLLGLDAPKRIESTGRDGGAIQFAIANTADFSHLTPQEQFALDQMLAKVIEKDTEDVPA